MELSITKQQKNTATLIHASVFSKYFIPLGNFLVPLILWSLHKNNSEFVDKHGKEAINFQLSMALYSIIIPIITVPLFFILGLPHTSFGDIGVWSDFNLHFSSISEIPALLIPIGLGGLGAVALFLVNLICTISATLKANQGAYYHYPFSIKFLK